MSTDWYAKRLGMPQPQAPQVAQPPQQAAPPYQPAPQQYQPPPLQPPAQQWPGIPPQPAGQITEDNMRAELRNGANYNDAEGRMDRKKMRINDKIQDCPGCVEGALIPKMSGGKVVGAAQCFHCGYPLQQEVGI